MASKMIWKIPYPKLPLFCGAIALAALQTIRAEFRDWESSDGRKTLAEFVKLDGDTIHLKLANGKIGKVEISKLSEVDQEFVRNLEKPPAKQPESTPEVSPVKKPEGKIEWPNDAGMEIPEDVLKPFVYPEGSARKFGDEYWSPEGKQIWKDAQFRGNGLKFHNGFAKTQTSMNLSNSKPGLVNTDGVFVIGGTSTKALPEGTVGIGDHGDNGLTAFGQKVGNEVLWGYMDIDGKVVLEPKWQSAGRFSQGLAAVSETTSGPVYLQGLKANGILLAGKYKYINEKGEVVVPGDFQMAMPFGNDGLAAVWMPPEDETKKAAEAWAFVRKDGSILVLGTFLNQLAEFRNGRLVTADSIYNTEGEKIFSAPDKFALFDAPDDSGVCILKSLLSGFPHRLVDRKSGQCYGPLLNYKAIHMFSEGLACFSPDGKKYGYIDRSGKIVIEPRFSSSSNFESGCISVRDPETGKIEYRNKKGELFKEG